MNNYVYVTDPIRHSDLSGKYAAVLMAGGLSTWSASLGGLLALAGPLALALGLAAVAGLSVAAITHGKSKPSARTNIKTKNLAPPLQSKKCVTYKNISSGPPKLQNPNDKQQQQAIMYTSSQLNIGKRPGGPIMGLGTPSSLGDRRYPAFLGWQKDALWYPKEDFEIHYMVNDVSCVYADLKTKNSFPYGRPLR